jgi:hypothetical protein
MHILLHFLPNAFTIKNIKNCLHKRGSPLATKLLVKLNLVDELTN